MTIRECVIAHLDAMLADPHCVITMQREEKLASDMAHDETVNRYTLGRLTISIQTPTLALEVREK